uniref:Mitochondrial transcription termination factor 2 n=1 Tax=Oncorhynchus mykiss TaxID=8022 RepID=A0A8K9UK81_ONCMY
MVYWPYTTPPRNQVTVEALYDLSVDIQKIHQLKGWVLHQSPAYVSEMASMLRDIGAEGLVNAWVLELYPEVVLCSPEQQQAQRELSSLPPSSPAPAITPTRGPTSTTSSLHLNKRIITKLMASTPCAVGQSEEIIHLELRGDATNMKIWLQKLLSQNPFVLLKPSEVLSDNLLFLETRDFTTAELLLLHLLSNMRLNLAYSKETLGCSEANCPALLYYPEAILAECFEGLLRAGQPRDSTDHEDVLFVCKLRFGLCLSYSYMGISNESLGW